MHTTTRTLLAATTLAASLMSIAPARATAQDDKPVSGAARRSTFGISLLGLKPQGEFAENVGGAGGIGGHYIVRLDPKGIVGIRADLGYLIYGREEYRTPLGTGPLGLIQVDVTTTNSIALGGLGLQLMLPTSGVRPYGNVSAGFSYFFTESSVEGSDNEEAFASSTNYSDGGFAWSAGGGLYIPLSVKRVIVNLDLGARWLDNGKRDYLRDDGITFENDEVQLHPVRSEAKGIQFNLGVAISFRR
jgi:opacity protein-like surface antigen